MEKRDNTLKERLIRVGFAVAMLAPSTLRAIEEYKLNNPTETQTEYRSPQLISAQNFKEDLRLLQERQKVYDLMRHRQKLNKGEYKIKA